jgi:aryl-alcohol dehydrogenase-like predicted oxidoreductase
LSVIEQGGLFRIGGEIEIHRLAYGALHLLDVGPDALGPPAPNIDPRAILRRVVELGINLIDTADIYGPETNELQISAALYPYPKGLIISTKGGLTRPRPGELTPNYDPKHLRSAVDGSLLRLKLEQIDVWTLHHVDATTPIEDVVGTLTDLRRAGKLRHIGLSKPSSSQLARARAIAPISMVQNRYNVADRRDDAVVDYCAAHGIGFMAFFPLAAGRVDRLRECVGDVAAKREVSIQQIALAWLLQRSPVLVPIPGTRILEELEDNVSACAIRLSAAEVAQIDARHAALPPITDGPSPIKPAAPPKAAAEAR